MNLTHRISMYESGELSHQQTIDLFQDLVDTGIAFNLQGHYSRMALHFIQNGLVKTKQYNEVAKDEDGGC